jgi:phage host-nuclease inhibitor protein Gam
MEREYSFDEDNGVNDPWGDDPFAEPLQNDDGENEEELAERLLPADKLSFEVTDAGSASWVVRKIVEAQARQQRIKDWAQAELRDARREEEFFRQRFGPSLEAWVAENLNGKKTLRLPDGSMGYRRRRPVLQIEDKEQLLDWCKNNLPDAVRVREDVLKTPLNEHLKETGEIPPGCDLDLGGDEFFVK